MMLAGHCWTGKPVFWLPKERLIMRTLLRKCQSCDEYTLGERCNRCEEKTIVPIPPRYSPDDKYGEYRRKLKKENLERRRG
jgi:H/ACA ribonucleoprotein complex subunit 3